MKRWKEHFEQLLNVENERQIREDGQENMGMIREWSRQEVSSALKRMKNAKAVGPDLIPVKHGRP